MTDAGAVGRGTDARPWRERARGVAVVLVLAVGVLATAATSSEGPPPGPPCPSPSPIPKREVSDFYGDQYWELGPQANDVDVDRQVGSFHVREMVVEVPSCVAAAADAGAVPVRVALFVGDEGVDVEPFARGAVLVDGDGTQWPVVGYRREAEDESPDDRLFARWVHLDFALPLDVPEPVALQLADVEGWPPEDGPAQGWTNDPIPLRPEPEPEVEPTPTPTPTIPWSQREHM